MIILKEYTQVPQYAVLNDCILVNDTYRNVRPLVVYDINKWTCTLSVPAGHTSAYQQAEQWKEFFFINDDVAGINSPFATEQLQEKARYDLNGKQLSQPQRGLNIVRMSDGTTKKVMVK